MTTQMNITYINALLADASYVQLTNANGDVETENIINGRLKARLTEPLAKFMTDNFEVLDQPGTTDKLSIDGGFSATVWRGKAGTEYAGQVYLSMRGTAEGIDFADDGILAEFGVAYAQITDMVNWWLKANTATDQLARVGRTCLRYAA
jgi:hypothetical protein